MFDVLGKMGEMKTRMEEAQKAVSAIRISEESFAGLVKATVTGDRRLIELTIDASLAKPEEINVLQDLVLAAVNKALTRAEAEAATIIKEKTAGLLPSIPGLDLTRFGK